MDARLRSRRRTASGHGSSILGRGQWYSRSQSWTVITPWLRLKQLARRFQVSERTIRRWILTCEDAGLVARVRITGHENQFRISVPFNTQGRLDYLSKTDKAQIRRWA